MDSIIISPELPPNDILLLRNLSDDIQRCQPNPGSSTKSSAKSSGRTVNNDNSVSAPGQGATNGTAGNHVLASRDESDLTSMRAVNDPTNKDFEPSVFCTVDFRDLSSRLHPVIYQHILLPYVKWAQTVARHPRYVEIALVYFLGSLWGSRSLAENEAETEHGKNADELAVM
ncbi:hypothetical protein F4805DRAFT_454713 [Annulohypoxylon moriforme]|nr:hypothetical protein F4805DRAFT_454713 [Annulohypoxylon moriforme]